MKNNSRLCEVVYIAELFIEASLFFFIKHLCEPVVSWLRSLQFSFFHLSEYIVLNLINVSS